MVDRLKLKEYTVLISTLYFIKIIEMEKFDNANTKRKNQTKYSRCCKR